MTQLIYPAIINTTGSTSGQYLKNQSGEAVWADAVGVAIGSWGALGGNISDQIDLGNALASKLDDSQAGAFGLSLLGTTTVAAGTALLNTFTTTLRGLVPAPTVSAGAFLKDDGTWAIPPTGEAFSLTDGTKGEVTVSQGGTVWTIDANVITAGKLQQIGNGSFFGRNTSGTGNVEVLSLATTKTLLGISNVNNTSDASKPVSTATQTALNAKVNEGLLANANLTMSPNSIAGRYTQSNGPVEEIVLGNGLTLLGSELRVEFADNGWGTSILVTGTAVPQNIELPETGLTPLDVLVFNDGVRFYSGEYTITGSTLQMTSNFTGDQIEIIKMPTRTILAQPQIARGVQSDNSTSYTPNSTAAAFYTRLTNPDPITFTVPSLFAIGTEIIFEQASTGTVTIVSGSGVVLNSRGNRFSSAGQYAVVTIKKVTSTTWVISGDVV